MSELLENLLYTKDHEWVEKNSDSLIVSGITDYAQESLGDIVFIEFPQVGKRVKQGEVIATIESVKSVSDIFAPVSGKIMEINSSLNDSPETVNKDPYQNGWLFKIEPEAKEEIKSLLDSVKYSEFIRSL